MKFFKITSCCDKEHSVQAGVRVAAGSSVRAAVATAPVDLDGAFVDRGRSGSRIATLPSLRSARILAMPLKAALPSFIQAIDSRMGLSEHIYWLLVRNWMRDALQSQRDGHPLIVRSTVFS
jgi:hypothetical protein